jgi:hypothetical protein
MAVERHNPPITSPIASPKRYLSPAAAILVEDQMMPANVSVRMPTQMRSATNPGGPWSISALKVSSGPPTETPIQTAQNRAKFVEEDVR